MAKKRILAVCGTGGVTSSVVAAKLQEIGTTYGIDIEITTAKVFEVTAKLASEHFDLIASATRVKETTVPVVNCMSFLSGVGEEDTIAQIVSILQK